MRRLVHLITPGDHFSPATGSAIPTVVNGLSGYRPPGTPRPGVLVAEGTYPQRYASAEVIEYDLRSRFGSPGGPPGYLDVAWGRVFGRRPQTGRSYRDALEGQERWEPAFVVAHNAPQAIPLVRTERHVPVIYAHNELLHSYSRREAGRVLGSAHAIVCVSSFLADLTSRRLPAGLRHRVAVVRNGVDLELFQRESEPGQAPTMDVVFLGRMLPEKGADVLVDACVRLGRPDIRLTVVGSNGFDRDAPLTSFERDLRRRAGPLGRAVRFEPFVDRVRAAGLLSRADVVVVPSRWAEPFALTAVEGMAAGAAVVASEVGGIPESVRGAGVLVPPGDSERLAVTLEGLADDRELLRRTARAGLDYARAHDWRWAAQRLDDVLASAP